MTDHGAASEPGRVYTGVMHVHSAYSHDGLESISDLAGLLSLQGLDFCVLTDHFEDFDDRGFERYLSEISEINAESDFVVVPAVEIEFEGVHVILVPSGNFSEVRKVVDERDLGSSGAVILLAHPAKYDLETVVDLLRRHEFDGIELWNQMADGKYTPPCDYLRALLPRIPPDLKGHFFGGDTHSGRHAVVNCITIPADGTLTVDKVLTALRRRQYVSHNRISGLAVDGGQPVRELIAWLETAADSMSLHAKVSIVISSVARAFYHLLPRRVQKRINNFKNSIKSSL